MGALSVCSRIGDVVCNSTTYWTMTHDKQLTGTTIVDERVHLCTNVVNKKLPSEEFCVNHDPTPNLSHHRRNVPGLPRILRDPGSFHKPWHPDERGIRIRHHAQAGAREVSARPHRGRV